MEPLNFDKPQRQSVVGIVIMFADSLQKFVRAMWVPLAIFLFRMNLSKIVVFLLVVLIILVVLAVIAYLKYRNFTFFLDEAKQEFVVQSGVLSKKKLSIGLDKIQQVNINQNVIQKLIGVYSLDIDTAGSKDKEVSIKAIDHHSAQLLKAKLLERENIIQEAISASETAEELQQPLVSVSLLSLLKLGLTSNYGKSLAVLIAFFFTIFDNVKNFFQDEVLTEEQIQEYIIETTFLTMLFVFGVLFLLTFVVNLIRTLIKYYDFSIVKERTSLLISYGFFAKKNTLLNPKKAQIVSYSQNFFQKKLNVLSLRIRQASSESTGQDKKSKSASFIVIPGVNTAEKEQILQMIFDRAMAKGEVVKPNFRYVFKKVYLSILLPVTIFLLAGLFINKELQAFFPLIGVYILALSLFIYFEFKHYKLFVNRDFIIKKEGAWDIEHKIIEPYKIQAITAKQYFWNKRHNVGHIILHTAAGDLRFNFANFTQINAQINYWLYQVESSDKNWM
ncbi:MAG TPA: PH domain-containing protein [Flavobacterium sp.]|nr:PH domain-containing protein [Flavobacterium sp.]